MEYEDLVKGYEGSLLAPVVAVAREVRATVRELGIVGIAQLMGCVALAYALMWVSCLWASL